MARAPAFLAACAVMACAPGGDAAAGRAAGDRIGFAPEYRGIETRLLDGDLVRFRVEMRGRGVVRSDVEGYARCAAAQYALIRGMGFARHVRTAAGQTGGVWRADAVYTVSSALPRGLRTLDAEVVVRDCGAQGIPTV